MITITGKDGVNKTGDGDNPIAPDIAVIACSNRSDALGSRPACHSSSQSVIQSSMRGEKASAVNLLMCIRTCLTISDRSRRPARGRCATASKRAASSLPSISVRSAHRVSSSSACKQKGICIPFIHQLNCMTCAYAQVCSLRTAPKMRCQRSHFTCVSGLQRRCRRIILAVTDMRAQHRQWRSRAWRMAQGHASVNLKMK